MKPRRPIKVKHQAESESLFKFPVPIPEPPRVINAKPSVPDLSITCEDDKDDFPVNGLNFNYNTKLQDQKADKVLANREREILSEIEKIKQRIRREEKIKAEVENNKKPSSSRNNDGEATEIDEITRLHGFTSHFNYQKTSGEVGGNASTLGEFIKIQQEKLEKISEQLQMLLKFQDENLKKKEPEKRSVATQTCCPSKSEKTLTTRRRSERIQKKSYSDSAFLTSESESRSDASRFPNEQFDDDLYKRIIKGVDARIARRRSDESDSCSRSSLSPPRVPKNKEYNITDAEPDTLIISKLAEKYLTKNKSESKNVHRKPAKKTNSSGYIETELKERARSTRPKRVTTKVSNFADQTSLSVKNYLEKYGLFDDD